ncbi:RNA polymerase sigma factor [Arthrobacter sp. A2-55]|nr:RNA polymerase sigma factor [Arthrobacter sp. A2-55]
MPPFEAVVAAHGTVVLRVCRALVGVQDADDVWQETFLAALRAYPESGGIRNREAWLVTIARNKSMDHHRRAGRLPVPSGDPQAPLAVAWTATAGAVAAAAGGDDVVRALEAGEDAAMVWSAVALLPEKQRLAVVYHHLAGLRHAEVAGLLGNSEAAARRAAADGLKALRVQLLGREREQP